LNKFSGIPVEDRGLIQKINLKFSANRSLSPFSIKYKTATKNIWFKDILIEVKVFIKKQILSLFIVKCDIFKK